MHGWAGGSAVGLEIKDPNCASPSLPGHPDFESPVTTAGRERGSIDYLHPHPLPGTPPAYHVSITSFPWEESRGQGGDPMWQKLRLYCACRWGRASWPTREAHVGPESGAERPASLTSEWYWEDGSAGNWQPDPRA
jgi:hypothetical protein